MDEATHMTQVETRETVAEGIEKHTVQTENGPIVYIEDKSWDAKDHPHREYKGAYRGFTEINVNGVKQKVFVSFDVENEEMYDYGPHGDYTSGPKQILRVFMRNANGSYSKIDVDIIDKYGMVGKGSISKEQAKEIYTGITTAYRSRMAELHPENESSTEGM